MHQHHNCHGGHHGNHGAPHGCRNGNPPCREPYYDQNDVGPSARAASSPPSSARAFDNTNDPNDTGVEQLAQVVDKLMGKMEELEQKLDEMKKTE